jgi:hypothetical protein
MTASRGRIENLILRIQSDFLHDPALALNQTTAQRRFDIDDVTCAGVLGALVAARVLTEHDGMYRRYFPQAAKRRAA